MHEAWTIGALAAQAQVGVETVRYYQRRDLMPVPERAPGQIARYGAGALTRLRFIRRAQSLGFSLEDVQSLLTLDDGQDCAVARRIGQDKLAQVRSRIVALQAMESALQGLVARCAHRPRRPRCPLIEALTRPDRPAVA